MSKLLFIRINTGYYLWETGKEALGPCSSVTCVCSDWSLPRGCKIFWISLTKFQYLATWCEESTHWKRPRCWERLRAVREGGKRGWDGWMASPTQWTRVGENSGRWWRTGKPGMLQSMELQTVGHDWATEQQSKFQHKCVGFLGHWEMSCLSWCKSHSIAEAKQLMVTRQAYQHQDRCVNGGLEG